MGIKLTLLQLESLRARSVRIGGNTTQLSQWRRGWPRRRWLLFSMSTKPALRTSWSLTQLAIVTTSQCLANWRHASRGSVDRERAMAYRRRSREGLTRSGPYGASSMRARPCKHCDQIRVYKLSRFVFDSRAVDGVVRPRCIGKGRM